MQRDMTNEELERIWSAPAKDPENDIRQFESEGVRLVAATPRGGIMTLYRSVDGGPWLRFHEKKAPQ